MQFEFNVINAHSVSRVRWRPLALKQFHVVDLRNSIFNKHKQTEESTCLTIYSKSVSRLNHYRKPSTSLRVVETDPESGAVLGSRVYDGYGCQYSKIVWLFEGGFTNDSLVQYFSAKRGVYQKINAMIAVLPCPLPRAFDDTWPHI